MSNNEQEVICTITKDAKYLCVPLNHVQVSGGISISKENKELERIEYQRYINRKCSYEYNKCRSLCANEKNRIDMNNCEKTCYNRSRLCLNID